MICFFRSCIQSYDDAFDAREVYTKIDAGRFMRVSDTLPDHVKIFFAQLTAHASEEGHRISSIASRMDAYNRRAPMDLAE